MALNILFCADVPTVISLTHVSIWTDELGTLWIAILAAAAAAVCMCVCVCACLCVCVCRFIDGTVDCDSYVFWHWWNIDIFVYFSHNFVTIPPLCWIIAGHLHHVKVLGILCTFVGIVQPQPVCTGCVPVFLFSILWCIFDVSTMSTI